MQADSGALSPTRNSKNMLSNAMDVACFAFFSLCLTIPSGYSYGSAAMALLSLYLLLRRSQRPRSRLDAGLSRQTWLLIASVVMMALLWSLPFDRLGSTWLISDYGIKYLLAALAIWGASRTGVRPAAVIWGLALGGLGAMSVAIYQVTVLHMSQAWGFTNAIQFGGIAMYMGLASLSMAVLGPKKWPQTALLALGGTCGLLAALLSEARGSWVTAPLLAATLWWILWRDGKRKLALGAVLAIAALAAVLAAPAADKFQNRAHLAWQEFNRYWQDPKAMAETSIGQRLEQWRLALRMIEERPIVGWGVHGTVRQKQAQVDQGMAHPSVMQYGHAHTEILDMWVKRGLLGVLALLSFYASPLYLFWPSQTRLAPFAGEQRARIMALRTAGTMLPLAYFGFGWTQVFFAHNSGNLFYIFALAGLWGSVVYLQSGRDT